MGNCHCERYSDRTPLTRVVRKGCRATPSEEWGRVSTLLVPSLSLRWWAPCAVVSVRLRHYTVLDPRPLVSRGSSGPPLTTSEGWSGSELLNRVESLFQVFRVGTGGSVLFFGLEWRGRGRGRGRIPPKIL